MGEVQKMSVKTFREEGYLQELNRMFLHPLGLALEVVLNPDGTESFGEVWDCQDDPVGLCYADGAINPNKAERINALRTNRTATRIERLGYVIQPEKLD